MENTGTERDPGLQEAIDAAGGQSALAEMLGISRQGLGQWDRVPPLRVLEVERATGVRRERLRPDIYPPDDAVPVASSEAAQ